MKNLWERIKEFFDVPECNSDAPAEFHDKSIEKIVDASKVETLNLKKDDVIVVYYPSNIPTSKIDIMLKGFSKRLEFHGYRNQVVGIPNSFSLNKITKDSK